MIMKIEQANQCLKLEALKLDKVFPQDTNHHHTMFGGTLMANIDEIAAITAMKHANARCNSINGLCRLFNRLKQVQFYHMSQWLVTLVAHQWKYVFKL